MGNSSQAREGWKARRAAKRAADPEVQARAAAHESERRRAAAKAARLKAKADAEEAQKRSKDVAQLAAQVHKASK